MFRVAETPCKLYKETKVGTMPLNSPECFGRADDRFLFTSRATGVLVQHRHTSGTWRDCTGDGSRPASNSISSFRPPEAPTVTEKLLRPL